MQHPDSGRIRLDMNADWRFHLGDIAPPMKRVMATSMAAQRLVVPEERHDPTGMTVPGRESTCHMIGARTSHTTRKPGLHMATSAVA